MSKLKAIGTTWLAGGSTSARPEADQNPGLTDGVSDQTKARYAFVYGDLRRVHRTALIACRYRAAEWRHKESS